MTETEGPKVRAWTHFYWDIFANTCWPFDEDEVICGRTEGQFQYEDNELSGSHCKFTVKDGVCFIEDMGSKNGTYLNLKELDGIEPKKLKCFDVIIFGSQIIIYLDVNIFKVETRDDIMNSIKENIDNENVLEQIKNKCLIFMRSHHPRLVIRKKIQVVEKKIANAYNIKDEKLATYDAKAAEIQGVVEQHKAKIKQLEDKIALVMAEKDKMAAKIDPQIDALHAQVEKFNDEIEALNDKTTV